MRNIRIESLEYLDTTRWILEIVNNQPQQIRFRLLVDAVTKRHHSFATRCFRNTHVHITITSRSYSVQQSSQKRITIIRQIGAHQSALVLDAELLDIVAIPDECVDVDQRTQSAHAVRLWVTFQHRGIGETQCSSCRFRVAWRYFLHDKLGHGGERLVFAVLAEALLFDDVQCDLANQHLDLDAEELVGALDDVLHDLMVIERLEHVQPAKGTVRNDDAALIVLDADQAINVFVVVASQNGVGGRIELVQRAWSHLEHGGETNAGPVMLFGVVFLNI